jgi:Uma2 family endonuclease
MSGMTGRGDMPTRRVKLTYDDYVLYPEDGLRHELIDGRHYVSAAPSTRHQRISARLLTAIASWLEAHPVGEVFAAPFDVVFTRFDVVEPDLVYISLERAATQLTELHARGADLVIEIASPSTRTRDETIKRQLYEQADVSEYWFVEPETSFGFTAAKARVSASPWTCHPREATFCAHLCFQASSFC